MKCPKCQHENREGAKFCKQCGARLELVCPSCAHPYDQDSRFCDECGFQLIEKMTQEESVADGQGERKHVTALFSDISGYTSMSERLDPEEVREISAKIFGEVSAIIAKYGGFIEKFAGDAVMAIFGVPKAHEDDPVRAIRAAREIHELVNGLSPELQEKIGRPLSMHTGINTGLVITGEVNLEKGTHGVAGDTINLAARLSSLARSDEILVGQESYRQTERYFNFQEIQPTKVKGKAEPIHLYRFLSPREGPMTVHRISGLRAPLIGRNAQMAELSEAIAKLRMGKGKIFSICGEAGTGKSRLVEEFKVNLNRDEIGWFEGRAYAYAQNISYFPLVDLLNDIFGIEEGDRPARIREKLHSGIQELIGRDTDIIPYVGHLYALDYPELADMSPQFFKSRLRGGIVTILSALAREGPKVFCVEDLHHADPSSIELFRSIMLTFRYPAVVLCLYRPSFALFTSQEVSSLGELYAEIHLEGLSSSEAQNMLEALLKTEAVPPELRRFVQDRAEGNPFYLEEMVNSLLESGTLQGGDENWHLTRPITESEVSFTIHGMIADRLDRLEKEMKRILQEASVIGKAFLYEILTRVTQLKQDIDKRLMSLERLDFIRIRSLRPDLEYMFKHALTQEVVYSGVLKKERQEIHDRIGNVIESLFQDRLSEFCETLAFHFRRGKSHHKAVDYLIKSGEKSLARYAVEESHQYFQEAFDILEAKKGRSEDEDTLLINLIIKWAYVFYYRGDFKGLARLLSEHERLADSLTNRLSTGMFHGWYGMALWAAEEYRKSYDHLQKALHIGEETGEQLVIGYACTWLTWTCAELGQLDMALQFGERAQKIAKENPSDHYIYFKSLGGIGFTHWYRGEGRQAINAGKAMVEFGEKRSDIRSLVMGYYVEGLGHYALGELDSGIECQQRASQISADPYYREFPVLLMGLGFLLNGQLELAQQAVEEVAAFSRQFGTEGLGTPAMLVLGGVYLSRGELKKGLSLVKNAKLRFQEKERKILGIMADLSLGEFYTRAAIGGGEITPSFFIKNIAFVVMRAPFASRKAQDLLMKAVALAHEMGAKGLSAQGSYALGLLNKAKGRKEEARRYLSEAVQIYEGIGAEMPLRHAKEALLSLAS